jgi:hypothetical protein
VFERIMHKKVGRGLAEFQSEEKLLNIKSLDKRTEVVPPTPGRMCAGARDRPPITGNVKRGFLPIAQLVPALGEAVLHARVVSGLKTDASLEELIQLRSYLLLDQVKPKRRRAVRAGELGN